MAEPTTTGQGHPKGPGATEAATARAMAQLDAERGRIGAAILVEGVSDQIAVETLANRQGRDLASEGVVVLPVGGAGGMAAHLQLLVERRPPLTLAGLVDVGEAAVVARAVESVGLGHGLDRWSLPEVGFQVCVEDLEDELIVATGPDRVEELLAIEGDLRSFRTLQRQPAWRDRPRRDQLRRFFGAGGGRKLRYAAILVADLDLDRMPSALSTVLATVSGPGSGSTGPTPPARLERGRRPTAPPSRG